MVAFVSVYLDVYHRHRSILCYGQASDYCRLSPDARSLECIHAIRLVVGWNESNELGTTRQTALSALVCRGEFPIAQSPPMRHPRIRRATAARHSARNRGILPRIEPWSAAFV